QQYDGTGTSPLQAYSFISANLLRLPEYLERWFGKCISGPTRICAARFAGPDKVRPVYQNSRRVGKHSEWEDQRHFLFSGRADGHVSSSAQLDGVQDFLPDPGGC